MKMIDANPTLIEQAQAWAQANPMEFLVGMVVVWGAICFRNATRYSF